MTASGTDGARSGDAERADVGEEVTRLTEALTGWWTSVTAGPAPSRHDSGPEQTLPDDAASAPRHDGASCRVCPLCRAMDLARAVRPDLLEKVALAAETVALLLRETSAGDPPADLSDVWGQAVDTDGLGHGTPIVVTDGDAPSTTGDEREGGRRAWD